MRQVATSPDKPLVWLHGEIKTPPIDPDAIVIAEVFKKKTKKTPPEVIDTSRQRLKAYDDAARGRSRK